MKTSSLIFAALLCFVTTAALSAPPPATAPDDTKKAEPGHGDHRYCESHADVCKDLASKFDQWCSKDPEGCLTAKAQMQHHREFCEKNMDKCQAERKAMREKMGEWCQTHPDLPHCAAMKKEKGEDIENDQDEDQGGAH